MHENSWQEKGVLITGGCGGVGEATAARFLSEGANVMLTDINETQLGMIKFNPLTQDPQYIVRDHWFRIKAKFVWKDAPEKEPETADTASGRPNIPGGYF